MTHRNVIVTGATGQQGGEVARNLITGGHTVRALVRDLNSEKSVALKSLGAELFEGDFSDRDSLKLRRWFLWVFPSGLSTVYRRAGS